MDTSVRAEPLEDCAGGAAVGRSNLSPAWKAGPSPSPITEERSAAVVPAAHLLEAAGHAIERLLSTELEPLLVVAQQCFEQAICAALARFAGELNPAPAHGDFEPMTWAAIERGRRLTVPNLVSATRMRRASPMHWHSASNSSTRLLRLCSRCAAACRGIADRQRRAFIADVRARPLRRASKCGRVAGHLDAARIRYRRPAASNLDRWPDRQ
jgi:hypothetical protein